MKMNTLLPGRLGALLGALVVTLALLFPMSAVAQDGDLKVGYVDLQRALNEVSEGQKAKASLKKDFESKQKKLNELQKELESLKKNLEVQAQMLSEDAKRKKMMEFQRKMYETQQQYMAMQQELAQEEAKATKKIFDKMGEIIEQIAEEKGYDLVLERTESAVLYADDSMDLTPELIKRYDAKY